MKRLAAILLRWRYALLTASYAPWLAEGLQRRAGRGDWLYVELGSRILFHHHQPVTAGPALHLYDDNREIQMGPPALLLAGPSQYFSPAVGAHIAAVVMALLLLPCLWCLEQAAATLAGAAAARVRVLVVGAIAIPIWTVEVQDWGHIDDVVALLCASISLLLVSRGRHDVVAGLVLGTAVAAKPWAVILLPLLFCYGRERAPRATLAFIVGSLGWWLPFVFADPATIHALGSLSLFMVNHPTWHVLGLGAGRARSWMRPLQLLGGIALSAIALRRSGWAAVPLLALAWRVTSDPYDWPYYIMGPLVGAALYDLARPARRRFGLVPWASISVVVVEWAIPHWLPSLTAGVRLGWFLVLVAVLLRPGVRRKATVAANASAALASPRQLSSA